MQTQSEAPDGRPGRKRGASQSATCTCHTAQRCQQMYYAILFISPALALYLVFGPYPFINTIYLSFTNWNGATVSKDFVGLSNYVKMVGDRGRLEGVPPTTSSG